MTKILGVVIILLATVLTVPAQRLDSKYKWEEPNSFLVLCYHSVPKSLHEDVYGVDMVSFIRQIEFLRAHGCNFISVDDIFEANAGKIVLPPKAVLLTFDDAYETYYTNVLPLLEIYGYPSLLGVVSGWIDDPPQNKNYSGFMTWEQIRRAASNPLVAVGSHSFFHHRGIQINPQGNTGPAFICREYYPSLKRYESEGEYKQRIYNDLRTSYLLIKEKAGVAPKVFIWPYGRFNKLAVEAAKKAGFKMMMTLDDGFANASDLDAVPRYMLEENPDITDFSKKFRMIFMKSKREKSIRIDIDTVYDPDPVKLAKNLDMLIERVYRIKPGLVFIQACSSPDENGVVKSVYFKTGQLPVKSDLFPRIARSLSIRGMRVFGCLPLLSFSFSEKFDQKNMVREYKNGKFVPTTSQWKRLSPFSPDAVRKIVALYADMARNSMIDGILFEDDGYLAENEDFYPVAYDEYLKLAGGSFIPYEKLGQDQKKMWTKIKTNKLNMLTEKIMKNTKQYIHDCYFSRIIYPQVIMEKNGAMEYSQSYDDYLKLYNYTVVTSYPYREGVLFPSRWLKKIVKKVKTHRDGLSKTIFELQAYNWKSKDWVSTETLDDWIDVLLVSGAHHVGYYPDSFSNDQPEYENIRKTIGTRDFPHIK